MINYFETWFEQSGYDQAIKGACFQAFMSGQKELLEFLKVNGSYDDMSLVKNSE